VQENKKKRKKRNANSGPWAGSHLHADKPGSIRKAQYRPATNKLLDSEQTQEQKLLRSCITDTINWLPKYEAMLSLALLSKLINLSHLSCQIHGKFFYKLWLAKSLAWQILAANQSGATYLHSCCSQRVPQCAYYSSEIAYATKKLNDHIKNKSFGQLDGWTNLQVVRFQRNHEH